VEAFGDRGVFADEKHHPGVSGAVLAFRHVWRPIKGHYKWHPIGYSAEVRAEKFATLAGIRDTFVRTSPDWRLACAQAEALMFYPPENWLALQEPFEDDKKALWADRMALGELLLQRNDKRTQDTIRDSFKGTTKSGNRFLILQNVFPTTDVGAATEGEVDIVIGFRYYNDNGNVKFQTSMRSQGRVDVAKIAKAYGGGGHTNAAGFTLDLGELWIWEKYLLAPEPDPISHILRLLDQVGV
jgi:hypothetical protein